MHRFAVALAGATLVLLFVGGMVTSTGSGMATPHWPLPDGEWFPAMTGEMLFEHGHRIVAAVVGLMTLVLAVWLIATDSRQWVRTLGIVALGAVAVQGLLGALTVYLNLPPAVSITHAGLSQLFFCGTLVLALATSGWWKTPEGVLSDRRIAKQALVATVMIYIQVILGAVYRHTHEMVFLHILGAVLVGFVAGHASVGATKEKELRSLGIVLLAALCAQLVLGAGSLTIAMMDLAKTIERPLLNAGVLSLHLAVGAIMLGTGLLITLKAYRLSGQPSLAEAPV